MRKPEKVYNETKIKKGNNLNLVKCTEFAVERNTRKLKSIKSSVPKKHQMGRDASKVQKHQC